MINWGECASWKNFKGGKFIVGGVAYFYIGKYVCDYFEVGKVKVLMFLFIVFVVIEMFNVFNVFLEDGSLVIMSSWRNSYFFIVMFVFFGLYFLIMYVLYFVEIFFIVLLDFNEWMFVFLCVVLVCLIDEVLKVFGRVSARREFKVRFGY